MLDLANTSASDIYDQQALTDAQLAEMRQFDMAPALGPIPAIPDDWNVDPTDPDIVAAWVLLQQIRLNEVADGEDDPLAWVDGFAVDTGGDLDDIDLALSVPHNVLDGFNYKMPHEWKGKVQVEFFDTSGENVHGHACGASVWAGYQPATFLPPDTITHGWEAALHIVGTALGLWDDARTTATQPAMGTPTPVDGDGAWLVTTLCDQHPGCTPTMILCRTDSIALEVATGFARIHSPLGDDVNLTDFSRDAPAGVQVRVGRSPLLPASLIPAGFDTLRLWRDDPDGMILTADAVREAVVTYSEDNREDCPRESVTDLVGFDADDIDRVQAATDFDIDVALSRATRWDEYAAMLRDTVMTLPDPDAKHR